MTTISTTNNVSITDYLETRNIQLADKKLANSKLDTLIAKSKVCGNCTKYRPSDSHCVQLSIKVANPSHSVCISHFSKY